MAATSTGAALGAEVGVSAAMGAAQSGINAAVDGKSGQDVLKAAGKGAAFGAAGGRIGKAAGGKNGVAAAPRVMNKNSNATTAGAKAFNAAMAKEAGEAVGTTTGALAVQPHPQDSKKAQIAGWEPVNVKEYIMKFSIKGFWDIRHFVVLLLFIWFSTFLAVMNMIGYGSLELVGKIASAFSGVYILTSIYYCFRGPIPY